MKIYADFALSLPHINTGEHFNHAEAITVPRILYISE
jgi:hypothetical protein